MSTFPQHCIKKPSFLAAQLYNLIKEITEDDKGHIIVEMINENSDLRIDNKHIEKELREIKQQIDNVKDSVNTKNLLGLMINALNLSHPAESISQAKLILEKIDLQYRNFLKSPSNLSDWLRMSEKELPNATDDLETFLVSSAEHESLPDGFLQAVLNHSKVIKFLS